MLADTTRYGQHYMYLSLVRACPVLPVQSTGNLARAGYLTWHFEASGSFAWKSTDQKLQLWYSARGFVWPQRKTLAGRRTVFFFFFFFLVNLRAGMVAQLYGVTSDNNGGCWCYAVSLSTSLCQSYVCLILSSRIRRNKGTIFFL